MKALLSKHAGGPETLVLEDIPETPRFKVFDKDHKLERSFRAIGDALATAGTFRLIDADDLSFHSLSPSDSVL